MKKCIDLTAYLLILLVFYSCNGDVFVDDFRSSDSELALDGNGDVAVIRLRLPIGIIYRYILMMKTFLIHMKSMMRMAS